MAQKVLIGGTAYELKPSPVLIDGTKYQIGGGRTLIGGTGYDVKLGPQKRTFTLTLPGTIYCSGSVAFSDGTNAIYFENGTQTQTQTREFEPGATITITQYYKQFNIVVLLYDNGTNVAWENGTPYTFVAETDCTLTASYGYDYTFGVDAMIFRLRH